MIGIYIYRPITDNNLVCFLSRKMSNVVRIASFQPISCVLLMCCSSDADNLSRSDAETEKTVSTRLEIIVVSSSAVNKIVKGPLLVDLALFDFKCLPDLLTRTLVISLWGKYHFLTETKSRMLRRKAHSYRRRHGENCTCISVQVFGAFQCEIHCRYTQYQWNV